MKRLLCICAVFLATAASAQTIFRQEVVMALRGSNFGPAPSFLVTAYEPGAIASANSSGGTITVYEGHGVAAGDRLLIDPGGSNTFTANVDSVTDTSIVFSPETYSVSSGAWLFNLGADTGASSPNYDGSPLTIYEFPNSGAITNEQVTTDATGEYEYWYPDNTLEIWELVRTSAGTPAEVKILRNSESIPKNAQIVTACLTGPCDYKAHDSDHSGAAIQAALVGTTGTKDSPVVILILPGLYNLNCDDLGGSSDCDTDNNGYQDVITPYPSQDDYTTLTGWSRDSVILASEDATVHNFSVRTNPTIDAAHGYPIAGGGDLEDFIVANLTFEHSNNSDCVSINVGDRDDRFEIRFDNVRFRCSWDAMLLAGSTLISPTKAPSSLSIERSFFELLRGGVQVSGNLNFTSRDNVFQSWDGTSQSDFALPDGSAGVFYTPRAITVTTNHENTRFVSQSDRFDLVLDDDASGVAASVTAPEDMAAISVRNANADIFSPSISFRPEAGGDDAFAASGILVGGEGGSTTVSSPVIRFEASTAGQYAFGFFHDGGGASLTIRDSQLYPSLGAGTEYSLKVADTLTGPWGEVNLASGTRLATIGNVGGLKIRNAVPKIAAKRFSAKDSVGLPATGAAFDANSEYRLYDDAADENASWRNEKVGSLFETYSRFTPRARVFWKPDSANSGNVVWQIGVCSVVEDAAFPCTVSVLSSVTDGVCATCVAGDLHISDWVDLTTGILAKSEGLVVQVTRNADDGSDTMTGDAALIAVEIQYGVD